MKNEKKQRWFYIIFLIIFAFYLFPVIFITLKLELLSYNESYINIGIIKHKIYKSDFSYLLILFMKNLIKNLANTLNFSLSEIFIYKIISIILFITQFILFYLVLSQITKDYKKRLFSLILFVTSPLLLVLSNSLLVEQVGIILLMLNLYLFFLVMKNNKFTSLLILILFISLIISKYALLLIPIIGIYLILIRSLGKKAGSFEKEILITFSFFVLLYYLFIFKIFSFKNVIYPNQISTKIDLISSIILIGIIQLLLGISSMFYNIYYEKINKKECFLISIAIAIAIFYFFNLVNWFFSLNMLLITLSLIAYNFPTILYSTFRKIIFKHSKFISYLLNLLCVIYFIISLSIVININMKTIPQKELIEEIEKIDNLVGNDTIVSSLPSSIYLFAFTNSTPVYFKNNKKIINSLIKEVFRSPFETRVIENMKVLNAKFVFLSNYEKNEFNVTKLNVKQPKKVKLVYNSTLIKVYKI